MEPYILLRWLLAKWTQPVVKQVEVIVAELSEDTIELTNSSATIRTIEAELQKILTEAQSDRSLWED